VTVDIARDMLDKLVVDAQGRELGRVDAVVLDQRPGEPPRLASILIGASVLGERVHPRVGRLLAWVERACGLANVRPIAIAAGHVTAVGKQVECDLTPTDTGSWALEQRVRAWLMKIPGGR
jgi:sporulation protein YlmC with PRC-barrel domain